MTALPWSRQMVISADATEIVKSREYSAPAVIVVTAIQIERLAGSFNVFWEWEDSGTQTWDLIPTRSSDITLVVPSAFGKNDASLDNNEANFATLKVTVSGTGSILLWARGYIESARLN